MNTEENSVSAPIDRQLIKTFFDDCHYPPEVPEKKHETLRQTGLIHTVKI